MPNQIIKISQHEFDSLKLINNNVAVEIVHRISEEKTKSGLIIVTDPTMFSAHSIDTAENYNLSQHLDRWGRVAKVPERLIYAKHNKMFGMDWETEIEIQVGDLVWADYYNLHHCPIFRVINGEEFKDYWIITYDCLIVCKRRYKSTKIVPDSFLFDSKLIESEEEVIIPINGYCLFEQVNEGLQSKFIELPKVINKKIGIVKYVGNKNKQYNNRKHFDDIDIQPGDEVIFRTESECLLEDEQHQYFEKENLRYEQRKNILGIKKRVPLCE